MPGGQYNPGANVTLKVTSRFRSIDFPRWNPERLCPLHLKIKLRRTSQMVKITLAVAAAAAMLTTVPLVTPAKAQGVKIAQGVDVQVGRDRDYDWGREYDRDRGRRYDSDTTVGVGPGGVTVGPRQRCRTVTTRVERDDGRMITRRERRCD
jgi:hypothetical protein